MKIHLMTMGHHSIKPCYRGLVEIDDKNFIDGETPIEDFGMYYYTPEDEPFPTDEEWMFNKFIQLIEESERGIE